MFCSGQDREQLNLLCGNGPGGCPRPLRRMVLRFGSIRLNAQGLIECPKHIGRRRVIFLMSFLGNRK